MGTPAASKPADDDRLLRTLFVGMVAGFILYALGLAALYVLPAPAGVYANIALTVVGLGFVIVWWFLTMKRGLRIGKGPNKRQVRAKEKQRAEREKLRNLRMRR
ncbi:MAG: hypothetical protein QOE90_513 [Thermoplasmata archaeon]|jgi:hypothetical protein|nr:hypothetical protein [Thermoplasmata archaeon]